MKIQLSNGRFKSIDTILLFKPLYPSKASGDTFYCWEAVWVDDDCKVQRCVGEHWVTRAEINQPYNRWLSNPNLYEFTIFDAEGNYAVYLGRAHEAYRGNLPLHRRRPNKIGSSIGYNNFRP